MRFVISKLLDHGTSHPVVARLHFQMGELLKNTTLGESSRQAVFSAVFHAAMRLIRCWDIWEKFAQECDKLEREYQPSQNKQVAEIPSVVGLQYVAETFLYEAKNFIRDLTSVINAGHGTRFDQASEFCGTTEGSKIRRWAAGQFGTEDRLTRFLALHETWLWELVQMRNAVEHPKGRSGILHVANYMMLPEGISRPMWHREANQPTYIVSDMAIVCDHMLKFAEELTVHIIEKHLHMNMLQIYEIPENERNPQCPRRFDIGFSENMAKTVGCTRLSAWGGLSAAMAIALAENRNDGLHGGSAPSYALRARAVSRRYCTFFVPPITSLFKRQ